MKKTKKRPAGKVKAIRTLRDLAQDPKNANKGTARGQKMLEASLAQYGAGRGVLVDRRGAIIAGNKTVTRALAKGLGVKVVRTRGDQLVVVQREDLDLRDPKARALALADNRVAEVDLAWDSEVVHGLQADGVDISRLWTEDELVKFLSKPETDEEAAADAGAERWAVLVFCKNEKDQQQFITRMQKDARECRALMS